MRIYRAKPIAWTDSSVALLNEYGATLGTPAPPAPDNALIPPATKPPLKSLPGPSRTQARKVREWSRKENYERRYLHAYSRCERRFFLPEVPGA